MAHEKQHWQDALRSAKQEGDRQDDRDNQRKKKRVASLHYKRRKLEKDVRKYYRDAEPIRFQSIEGIGRRHGFHVGGTPFRENTTPHDDA